MQLSYLEQKESDGQKEVMNYSNLFCFTKEEMGNIRMFMNVVPILKMKRIKYHEDTEFKFDNLLKYFMVMYKALRHCYLYFKKSNFVASPKSKVNPDRVIAKLGRLLEYYESYYKVVEYYFTYHSDISYGSFDAKLRFLEDIDHKIDEIHLFVDYGASFIPSYVKPPRVGTVAMPIEDINQFSDIGDESEM